MLVLSRVIGASVTVLGRLRQYGWWMPVLLAGFYLLHLCHRTPLGQQLGIGCGHCQTVACDVVRKSVQGMPESSAGPSDSPDQGPSRSGSLRCCAGHPPREASEATFTGTIGLIVDFPVGPLGQGAVSQWTAEATCLVCEAFTKLGQAAVPFTEHVQNLPLVEVSSVLNSLCDVDTVFGYSVRGPPLV